MKKKMLPRFCKNILHHWYHVKNDTQNRGKILKDRLVVVWCVRHASKIKKALYFSEKQ